MELPKNSIISNSQLNDKKETKLGKSIDLFSEKKKSADFQRQRILKASNRIEKRKISMRDSFLSYNNHSKINNSRLEPNSSRNALKLDYKGIEQEIKNVILEMKDEALLEIKRQSCIELELYKNKQQLKEELNDSHIVDINHEEIKEMKNKKKKFRKSKTDYGKNFRDSLKKNKSNLRNNKKKIDENNNSLNISKDNKNINDNINLRNNKIASKSYRLKTERKSLLAERFRFYGRGGVIEDSFDENESDEEYEEDSFLINPESNAFLIYDMIIFIGSLYCLIFIPYDIINEYYCYGNKKNIKFYLNYGIDILFIIDLIINFFLEYYNKKEKLIKNRMKIINHYLKGWFFFDFLTALPFNILYNYYCKYFPNKIFYTYEKSNIAYYLILLKNLKSIKIFKMPGNKKNQFITRLTVEASDNPSLNEKKDLIIELLLFLFGLHILSCIHIFIGRYAYPGWIFANEFQNFSLLNIYMISLYYLIQTMTTVGYGDISSDSFIEIIFRIILLAVGIICYSWLISNISNSINKQSYASINFSNDLILLENIRRDHTDLPFSIYRDIKNYLEHKHFRRNIYDKNLLINSLAYSLKNNLLFSMYKSEIERFSFFKGISNTNFLSELLYNFSSAICKKNEIIMNENEIIEKIVFVKEGRLSLELPIDMENPEISTEEYLSQQFMNFAFNFDSDNKFNIDQLNISKLSISSLLEERRESNLFQIKKEKLKKTEKEEHKILYLRIFDIHKNEDYGEIYMFYGKRSPFKVKVKSKKAKLYTIKRDNFFSIIDTFKNIIKRNHKKEKKHLKKIKDALIKAISRFCSSEGIKIAEEHKKDINKAIKKINNKMLPDILKNARIGNTLSNNSESENNKALNKSITEFAKNPILKPSTIKKSKKEIINEKRNIISNLMKEKASSLNNLNIRKPKRSLNFLQRGNFGLGMKMLSGFNQSYIDFLYSPKNTNSKQKEDINKIINIKLENTKKRYSQPLIRNAKTTIKSNFESNKSLKEIEFNYSESQKSKKTIKLNQSIEDSKNLYPITIHSLPKSLKKKIKKRIKNKKVILKHINNYKIEHISIEINNNNATKNDENINNKYNKNNFSNCNISNINNNSTVNDTNNNTNNMSIIKYDKYDRINSERKNNNLIIKDKNINPKNKKNILNSNSNNNKKRFKTLSFKKTGKQSTKQSLLRINLTTKNLNIKSPKTISAYNKFTLSHRISPKHFNKINFLYNDDLSSTSVNSFEIKRSYKNINQLSGGRYIKDKKFQKKTGKFIRNFKKEKQKIERLKTLLTNNFDNINNNKGEKNQFKKIENTIKAVKTKMSDIILKKKKDKQKEKNIKKNYFKNNHNMIKSNKSNSPKNKVKRKSDKKQLTLNFGGDMNNISLRLNSFSINPDETIGKLNISNDEIKLSNIS